VRISTQHLPELILFVYLCVFFFNSVIILSGISFLFLPGPVRLHDEVRLTGSITGGPYLKMLFVINLRTKAVSWCCYSKMMIL
jgi:hypothetical protein